MYDLLKALSEAQSRMDVQGRELVRRRSLRSVAARFKPGEVDDLHVDGRELRFDGVVYKGNKVGKLVRHYFLFSDALLTAEALKGSRATSWLSSHAARAGTPPPQADVEQLRKCKYLALGGARLRLPPGADDNYFEISFADGSTNHLWCESADVRTAWLTHLRRVIADIDAPPPPPPHPPVRAATDAPTRTALLARLPRCYDPTFLIRQPSPPS